MLIRGAFGHAKVRRSKLPQSGREGGTWSACGCLQHHVADEVPRERQLHHAALDAIGHAEARKAAVLHVHRQQLEDGVVGWAVARKGHSHVPDAL